MLKPLLLPSICLTVALATTTVLAADDQAAKEMSGMSVLGNSEAPKSLVIVPWKSSEIGDGVGISNMLDDRARPVDKDVFQRELTYAEMRTGAEPKSAPIMLNAISQKQPEM